MQRDEHQTTLTWTSVSDTYLHAGPKITLQYRFLQWEWDLSSLSCVSSLCKLGLFKAEYKITGLYRELLRSTNFFYLFLKVP